jgi:hypothetical protein
LLAAAVLVLAILAVMGPALWRGDAAVFAHPASFLPWGAEATAEERYTPLLNLDGLRFTYPAWDFAHRSLAEGRLPLWNPGVFGGHDHAGSIQPAVFSPITLLFALLPPARATTLHLLAHTLLLGLGMIWFLRGRGLGAGAAALGALGLSLSGYLLAKMGQPTTVATLAWLPLLLRLQDLLLDRPAHRLVGLYALVLAASALSGHPQIFLFNLAVLVLFGLGTLVRQHLRWQVTRRALLLLLVACLLALSMASVQAVSFWSGGQASRGFSGEDRPPLFRPPVGTLWGLVVPEPYGSLPEGTFSFPETEDRERSLGVWHSGSLIYPGLLVLLLMPLAGPSPDRRGLLPEALVLTVLPFLVLHVDWIHDALQQTIPGLGFSRMDRILILTALGLSLLAATGAERLRTLPARRVLALTGGAVFLVLVLAGLFLLLGPLGPPGLPSARRTLLLAPVVIGGLALCRWRALPVQMAPWLLVAVLLVDLVPLARKYFVAVPSDRLLTATEATRYLAEHLDHERFIRHRCMAIPPNTGQVLGLRDAQGFSPLYTWSYRKLYALIEPPHRGRFRLTGPVRTSEGLGSPILPLLGVRYLVVLGALEHDDWNPVYRGEGLTILESRRPARRVRLVPAWRTAADPEEAMAFLLDPGFDPDAEVVLLPGATGKVPPAGRGGPGRVRFLEDGDHRVDLEVEAPAGGMLLLSDTYHPFWTAWVNGREVPVHRADLALRAVRVPAGTSRVSFRYQPRPLAIAAGIGLATMVLALGLTLWPSRRRATSARNE